MNPFASPLVLTGNGLLLRDFTDADLPAMVELFDDPDVALRTPIVTPFDLAAARDYLAAMRRTRVEENRLHLAITRPGEDVPLGMVFLRPALCLAGYVVGKAHRRQGLAVRAGQVITGFALRTVGLPHVLLEIEAENVASVAVARALGARLSGAAPIEVTSKGRSLRVDMWIIEPEFA
ncbi:GNAT family N-acetyltransferase [Kutzneria sp. CA-103260]|uniref:GNAT family N-acetyltransferase n=1 Tax=Kutzneria sp. CA-103260 TaxID=2802641 RepID=UPI001BAACDA3|nr:GNAT family N-acetyltransferase [Kutzneria sp. CA-103260]QUQ67590.1 Acetyltransferase (GNAT) domain protein [Kutzneria sp. CA-103260]